MTWNYRAIQHEVDGEQYIAIHEVYYDGQGTPCAFAVEPCPVVADDVDGMRQILTRMLASLDLRPLNPDDFSQAINPDQPASKARKTST